LLNNDIVNKNIELRSCLKTINNRENDINIVSVKEKPLTDKSVRCQVLNRHKRQSGQVNETIFSSFSTSNISVRSSSEEQRLTPLIPVEGNVDSLNSEHSISLGDTASKWQSFCNKANQKPGGNFSEQLNDIKNTNKMVVKKERYQIRAITRKVNSIELNRKRKQDSVGESNKKICNEDRTRVLLVNPLTENSPEIVTFSYLRNRRLKELKLFIDKTGGSVTDEITQCTVLVTDKIRCTMKILSAIARGCPIVNTNWIRDSYTLSSFQDVSEFIIMDKDAEGKYNFRLKESLARARTNRLLDGYTVLVTPSVKPCPKDMKVIITCAGGDYVMTWPNTRVRKELIVTCKQDLSQWKPMWNNSAAKIIDSDTLIMSVIRQKLNI